MRKILKTQGSLNQWIDLVSLSLEQMGLITEINDNNILALHNGLQVMKFELTEKSGVLLSIDYFDNRDLDDFKKFAAQIITDPDSYRSASKTPHIVNTNSIPEKNINDYVQLDSMNHDEKNSGGKKGLRIALIILSAVIFLAAVGFGGYKIYQNKTVPNELLSEAMIAYNSADYQTAIILSDSIINTYPDSKQASDAKTLKTNAQNELNNLNKQYQTSENTANAQSHILITSTSLSGPDENGDVSILLDYTNTFGADMTSITFGISFTDANGQPVIVNGADSAVITYTDYAILATGQSKGEGVFQLGPYNNSNVTGYTINSVTATYADGTTITLATPEEVAWIISQQ